MDSVSSPRAAADGAGWRQFEAPSAHSARETIFNGKVRWFSVRNIVHLAVTRTNNSTIKAHASEVNDVLTHSASLTTLTGRQTTRRGQHQLSSDQTARHRHH